MKFVGFRKWVRAVFIFSVAAFFVNKLVHWNDFRFENFDTAEELIVYMKNKFPEGSDGKSAVAFVEKAGAKCEDTVLTNLESNTGYARVIRCVYNSGWISSEPLKDYILVIYIDPDSKIVELKSNKGYSGP